MIKTCPSCQKQTDQEVECPFCGIIFEKYKIASWTRKKIDYYDPDASENIVKEAESSNKWIKIFAIPSIFLMAWILSELTLFKILNNGPRLWFHEFGHAFIGWFSGRASTPFLGWTSISPDKSWMVMICFSFLLGVFAWTGWKIKSWWMVGWAVLLFLAQIWFSFISTEYYWQRAMLFSGIGGEMFLAAIVVSSFDAKASARWRWDFLRWIVVPAAMLSLVSTFKLWLNISHELADMPWGSLYGGADHQGGDMNRLVSEYDLNRYDLIASYLNVGYLSFALIGIRYLWGLVIKR